MTINCGDIVHYYNEREGIRLNGQVIEITETTNLALGKIYTVKSGDFIYIKCPRLYLWKGGKE